MYAAEPDPVEGARQSEWRQRMGTTIFAALIIMAGLLVYANSFTVPLLFDDLMVIAGNPTIHDLSALTDVLSPPRGGSTVQARPVINLSFAINYALAGQATWGYHMFNLAVHLLAGLTLFGIVRRTLRLVAQHRAASHVQSRLSDLLSLRLAFCDSATLLAFLSALIWTVHPLQTMCVTYISQRAESMMGLMILLTLYGFIRGAEGHPALSAHAGHSRAPSRLWFAFAILACTIGMGCKEVMVTAPLLMLAYDRAFLAGSWRVAWKERRPVHLALIATWFIWLALEFTLGGERNPKTGFGSDVSSWRYLVTQAGAILHYLRLTCWPDLLCLDYYDWPLAAGIRDVWPALLVVGTLFAATVVACWRVPQAGYLGLWFFLILAPTSSVMPIIDRVSEHRLYLPLAALVTAAVLVVGLSAVSVWRRFPSPETRNLLVSWLGVVTVSIVAALGVRTAWRNMDYRSNLNVWLITLAQRPANVRACMNVGALYGLLNNQSLSMRYLWHARELDPTYEPAAILSNLGSAYMETGDYRRASTLLNQALQEDPAYASAYFNRGNLALRQGLTNAAMGDYVRTIANDPDFTYGYVKLGALQREQGRLEPSVDLLTQAIARNPRLAAAYAERARTWFSLGQYDHARADLERCCELGGRPDPAFAAQLRAQLP
ncbi:MAG: tetratricopeptide repeat protein [Lentisphaerae bacterium]|nr:tetratricopeptide repeat protein [Lentisphaerota bacterium]